MGGRAVMRVGAILSLVVAAFPPAVHAGPRADYRQVFTTSEPGASTGLDTQILYEHPDDPNAKPIPIRREVFTFPAGTEFDDSVVPDCVAPDLLLRLQGEAACPAESWIGSGHGDTSMSGFPGAGETALSVNAYDQGGGRFRVIGQPEGLPMRFVAKGRRVGRTTTVEVPSTPGGPPDGESALRRIHNVFPARSLGDRAYVRTPRTCPPSGVWTFRARMTFADGVVERNVHRMACDGR